MVVIHKSLKINSDSKFQIVDITSDINKELASLNLSNGIVNVFSKHSTTGIVINENESGLLSDFKKSLEDVILSSNNYKHDRIDNNASSHLKAFLIGSSQSIPIIDNKLDLGTWQSVFFVELDGPRVNRTITLTFIGE